MATKIKDYYDVLGVKRGALLVLCAFILTLGVVLRYAGVRTLQAGEPD